ncbi:peptidase family M28 [Echria macrotheca]|uniref:Peptide hydrolase n=1 Tax=Echria macrotheca TaxID=438768 RepID=A0AAJ0F5Z4_9PEZI|nr:peptidase family M28 [Echria macrotheca]
MTATTIGGGIIPLLPFLLFVVSLSSSPFVSGYTPLSASTLNKLPALISPSDFTTTPGSGGLLSPLLIPRVPGTEGSARARRHFLDFFREELPRWSVEVHNSSSVTPVSGGVEVEFVNLVLRRDPPWRTDQEEGIERLTLVAHYDSLYRPEGFIGAVDSAAACAILLGVVRGVDEALTRKWERQEGQGEGLEEDVGVQILLLDGEEAWEVWSDTDSLYGARALASDWDAQGRLRSIGLFVLLDLLGAPGPSVPSYFAKTHWAYRLLAGVEGRLRDQGGLETTGKWFGDMEKKAHMFTRHFVLDDHVPFMERGVDVLHVIPSPFPDVWHTMEDDGDHLDGPTVRDWARIFMVFVAEWLELDGFFGGGEGYLGEKDEL